MNIKELKEFFDPNDIEWRIQSSGNKNGKPWGKCLAYVTNRAIMDRLDEVCGQENWRNEFMAGPSGGVLCGISIKVDSEWVTKWDGAENTNIEQVKGGLSSAMKRAAVQWGIGRFLYNFPEGWAVFCEDGKYTAKIESQYHKWNPPVYPKWALPEGYVEHNNLPPSIKPSKEDLEKERIMKGRTKCIALIMKLYNQGEIREEKIKEINNMESVDGLLKEHDRLKAEIDKLEIY